MRLARGIVRECTAAAYLPRATTSVLMMAGGSQAARSISDRGEEVVSCVGATPTLGNQRAHLKG
jgi:hypothetical protein